MHFWLEKKMSQESLKDLYNIPCFRNALMWGIGMGLMIGGHRYRNTRNVVKAVDWSVKSFVGVSTGAWIICRANYFGHKAYNKKMVEQMNKKEEHRDEAKYFASEVEKSK